MTEAESVYGQALYDLAKCEGLSGEIRDQLQILCRSFKEEPAFLKLLGVPAISKGERCQILDGCFRGKVHPFVLNFMKILTEKGDMRHFAGCCEAYRQCCCRDNGVLLVHAVTAVPLTPEQLEKLTKKLMAVTGKRIEVRGRVDPKILGGVRLDLDGKRLDDSLAHRLEAVRRILKNAKAGV